jgi:hypothetical protein
MLSPPPGEKIHRDNRGYGEPKTGLALNISGPPPIEPTHQKKCANNDTSRSTHALIGAFQSGVGDHQATK